MDDGLNIRKTTLLCFETLLDVIPDSFDSSPLLEALTSATVKDGKEGQILLVHDKDEIKFSAFQVLNKDCLFKYCNVIFEYF